MRIRYRNTECRHGTSAELTLEDAQGAVYATQTVLDGGSEANEAILPLTFSPRPGTRVVLSVYAIGGLDCIGDFVLDSVALLPAGPTSQTPAPCPECVECARRMQRAQEEASAIDPLFALGQAEYVRYGTEQVAFLLDLPFADWLTARIERNPPKRMLSPQWGDDEAGTTLSHQTESGLATLVARTDDADRRRVFFDHFRPAADACLALIAPQGPPHRANGR